MHKCECLIGARGRYNPVSGASFCEECPAGTLSLEDRTACRTCLAGEYSFEGVECKKCPAGYYAPQAITDACILCLAGFSTNNVTIGATTCSVSEKACTHKWRCLSSLRISFSHWFLLRRACAALRRGNIFQWQRHSLFRLLFRNVEPQWPRSLLLMR